MVGASQRLASRQESCRDSRVCALTSKQQVGVLLGEHRGWILRIASLYKVRPEACWASFQTKKTGTRAEVREGCGKLLYKEICNILLLSHILTLRNQLSPSRRLVPLSLQKGASFCKLPLSQLLHFCVFIKRKKCNILPLFPLIHIQRSTFNRPDCCGRLQTTR